MRITPCADQQEAKKVALVKGARSRMFIEESASFPQGHPRRYGSRHFDGLPGGGQLGKERVSVI